MEKKEKIVHSQNHNLRCTIHLVFEECQVLPILHQEENKQQVSAATHGTYCVRK